MDYTDDYKWTIPSGVYLLKVGNSRYPVYKIGCSSEPNKRRRQIQNETGTPVELVASFAVGSSAYRLEQAWLRFFRPVAIKPHRNSHAREWFYLTERHIRLFKHLNYFIAKRVQANPETPWYAVFGELNIEALQRRFGIVR